MKRIGRHKDRGQMAIIPASTKQNHGPRQLVILGWTNKCSLYSLISDIRRGCRRRYLICVNGEFVRPEYPVPEAYAREFAVAIDRVGPQDKEYRPPERTYPQLAKAWDDFCEPIRRRYGIPVWREGR